MSDGVHAGESVYRINRHKMNRRTKVMRIKLLANQNQRRSLWHNISDAPCRHTVSSKSIERSISRFRCHRHQQAAGCLRIEQQILPFLGNAGCKLRAVADKRAIVFQPAGKMSLSRCLDRTGKIFECQVIDFE